MNAPKFADIASAAYACVDFIKADTLNQKGTPVAFFLRTLQPSELKNVEKRKCARGNILYTRRHFTLKIVEVSVNIFDQCHKRKMKNKAKPQDVVQIVNQIVVHTVVHSVLQTAVHTVI